MVKDQVILRLTQASISSYPKSLKASKLIFDANGAKLIVLSTLLLDLKQARSCNKLVLGLRFKESLEWLW